MKSNYKCLIILLIIFCPGMTFSLEKKEQPISDFPKENMKYDKQSLENKKNLFIIKEGDLPIGEINIKGLKRTKEEVIRNLILVKEGDPLSLFEPHRLINNLKKKSIFTSIEINYFPKNNKVIIDINLKEKWTLIILPMFSSNEDRTTGGAFIIESNFLGMAKILISGGTYSEKGANCILGYIDPSVYGTLFKSNIFFIYKNDEFESGTMENNIYSRYKAKDQHIKSSLGYEIFQDLSLYLQLGYRKKTTEKGYDKSYNEPESGKNIYYGAMARLNKLNYYEYLYYGLKIEGEGIYHTPLDEENTAYYTYGLKTMYSFNVFTFHRITAKAEGFFGNRPEIMEETLTGQDGFRTLPSNIIKADNYINANIIYEMPLMRFNWGAITILGMWEQGRFNRDNSKYIDYYGPGTGFLVYIKKLAVPAMGLNFSRNLVTNTNETTFMLGFSF